MKRGTWSGSEDLICTVSSDAITNIYNFCPAPISPYSFSFYPVCYTILYLDG